MLQPLIEKTERGLTDENAELGAWPVALCGDKGYRADWIDELLEGWDIWPIIPRKANERPGRTERYFDRSFCRGRNVIERLVGWLKENRRICVRYEKLVTHLLGMIYLAFILQYLGILSPGRFSDRA